MELSDLDYRKVMRKGWNLTPAVYDRLWTPILREHSLACVERLALRPGERVLDVATGPGTAARMAAERVGPGGQVVGTDIADAFIAAGGAAAGPARFERHPMEQLGLPDASFDAATCVLGLMYAAPVSAALAEIARVLAPGGRFAACVWGRRERCAFREVFPILGSRLQMEVCPLFFALGVPGGLVTALERAGFVDAREERVDVTLRWSNGAEACAAMFDGGPGALPWSMFPDDVRRAVCDEYLATIEPWRRGDRYEAPAEFVYATARRPRKQ